MTESGLVDVATRWVVEKYPYNSHHLIRALEWLDRVAPGSREAVRLATLTHDMERAFPGPDQPVATTLDDPAYYIAHSNRSARMVGAWLGDQGAGEDLIREVEDLIRAHEFGGWPDADLVQAADSLSFLETNVDLFLGFVRSGKYSARDVNAKFAYTYDRIRVSHARDLARPLFDQALGRLNALAEGLRR